MFLKAGLDMWTRCLAEEGESENISALAIAPGIVDTGMQGDTSSGRILIPTSSKFH